MNTKLIIIYTVLIFIAPLQLMANECVVLLHGLARTSNSMDEMASFLSDQGYHVINIDYPSRKHQISELADIVRAEIILKTTDTEKIHVITHSLGGIILRYIQKYEPLSNIGRVVMLAPPNHGSELVDKLADISFFQMLNGPAGSQLGTAPDSLCKELGPVHFELGVITGDWSINWINSLIIPGKDDGKVSIENAKIEGMRDFLVMHTTHPLIMQNKLVQSQCLHFLQNGRFARQNQLIQ